MSLVTANDIATLEAHVSMPRIGAWVADMVLDTDAALADGASVTLKADGGIELVGSVLPGRSREFIGAVTARIAAGKAGLSKPATPRYYAGAKVGDIIDGLLADAGETISTTSDQSLLAQVVDAWLVLKQPVSRAITVLLEKVSPATAWRVLPDGKLWVGTETWPDVDAGYAFEVIAERGADASAELGAATPLIAPGMNVPGVGRASHVEHWVTADKVRSIVTCETGSPRDRIKGALAALARGAVLGIDYLTMYHGKVVKQSGQKVDVQPDDDRLPGLTDVPIRNGLPGVEVTVQVGAFIRVGWDNGDPRKPYAALWDGGEAVTKLVLKATMVHAGDESGSKFLATKDDLDAIKAAISGAAVVAQDGGAAFKSNIIAAWPASVGTTNVKGK